MIKIFVDPISHPWYSSFYIKGLYDIFGKSNVKFDNFYFSSLPRVYLPCFNFVVVDGSSLRKFSIDFNDPRLIQEDFYRWSDVYGKINLYEKLTTKEEYPKVVSMAPGFGISLWNIIETGYYALSNSYKVPPFGRRIKDFIRYYGREYSRVSYDEYVPNGEVDENYVFSLNTIWEQKTDCPHDDLVTKRRSIFIKTIKSMPDIEFEGGLVPMNKRYHSNIDKFKDSLYLGGRISAKSWINKTKKSLLVFNTPSGYECHGWKLAEYLALGKAIISTSISNELPSPLIHGQNIHFVDGSEESIREAIDLIVSNREYRKKLEKGAYAYWETYGTPIKSLNLLGL